MTKKDYEKIAKALHKTGHDHDWLGDAGKKAWEFACMDMADMLAEDNPRFDRDRFLAACGVR